MSISHTRVPARTDVTAPATDPSPLRPHLWHGRVLSGGAIAWAVAIVFFGLDPVSNDLGVTLFGIGSLMFQIGLLALLRVLWRTHALGEGRIARAAVRFEAFLVCGAIGSTLADTLQVSDLSSPGWAALDAFWPFSMLGMFFIGVRVAIAGRWTGVRRFWPMVAESWAVVVIPTMGIAGEGVGAIVAAAHLLIGYTVLGVLVSNREQ